MDSLIHLKQWLDPHFLITHFSYLGIALIVFAESGLLIGFFFPGDSLLLVAGVSAATGLLGLPWLVLVVFLAAFLGDQVGYWTGSKFGRRLFERENSWLFHRDHVVQAEHFFRKHGHKAIILGRFVPVVRTFVPILAGIGTMPYRVFVTYNLLGAALWGIGILCLGYFLGTIPGVDRYLHVVIAVIVVVSIVPMLIHLRSHKK